LQNKAGLSFFICRQFFVSKKIVILHFSNQKRKMDKTVVNNAIKAIELSVIQSKIYVVRGIKVMLDFDLSEMYETETGNLKRQVRRNMDRFPDDFMFELTRKEFNDLRC